MLILIWERKGRPLKYPVDRYLGVLLVEALVFIVSYAHLLFVILYFGVQAVIKMDDGGSFYIKNIGKCSIFVNSKEVPCNKRLSLMSDSLLEVWPSNSFLCKEFPFAHVLFFNARVRECTYIIDKEGNYSQLAGKITNNYS
jgi:hypothetical protein